MKSMHQYKTCMKITVLEYVYICFTIIMQQHRIGDAPEKV